MEQTYQVEQTMTEEVIEMATPEDLAAKLQELGGLYNAAIVNQIFIQNPKRIQRAIEALRVPVSDDRAYQQFYNHARKDLIEIAFKEAIKKNCAPVDPTEEAISDLAKKRQAEAAEKAKQKADKKK